MWKGFLNSRQTKNLTSSDKKRSGQLWKTVEGCGSCRMVEGCGELWKVWEVVQGSKMRRAVEAVGLWKE